MKRFQKVLAAFLAVILVASLASCVPATLNKEWSYKYGNTQYDIGVYVYALRTAYSQAQNYAQDVKGYKEDEPFLDLKIKDDDGNKAVARDWVLDKAKEVALEFVAVNKLFKQEKATVDEATMTAAKEETKNMWEIGPMYSDSTTGQMQRGYYPYSDIYEPYGVSYNSFEQIAADSSANTPYSLKINALFDALYGEGGSSEVTDKQLEKYFTEGYADYSYITVNLYDVTTDDDGNSTNKAFSSKKIKKIQSVLEGYVDEINGGSSDFAAIYDKCVKKYNISDSNKTENRVDNLDDLKSSDKEVYSKVVKLKNGKASLITKDADGDAPTAYIIVKNDITNDVENYVKGAYRSTVLHNMKDDTYDKYLEKAAKALDKDEKFSANDGAINSYSPDIFFEKPEETTESTDAT